MITTAAVVPSDEPLPTQQNPKTSNPFKVQPKMTKRKKDSKESFNHAVSTVQSDRSFESLKKHKKNISVERTTAYDPTIDKLNADLPISKMNITST